MLDKQPDLIAALSVISLNDTTVNEADGKARFSVSITPPLTQSLQLAYSTSDGSARGSSDYTAASGKLYLAAGVSSYQLAIPIINDTAIESAEGFTLAISNLQAVTVPFTFGKSQAIATIQDDESSDGSASTAPPTATATQTRLPATNTPTNTPTLPVATAAATATRTPMPSGSCKIDYVISNDWGTGFVVNNLVITNNTGAAINGWRLTWSFPGNQQITNLWNGVVIQTGAQVTVTNAPWNPAIPNGGTVSFGFQASYSKVNAKPSNFALNGLGCTRTTQVAGSTATEEVPFIEEERALLFLPFAMSVASSESQAAEKQVNDENAALSSNLQATARLLAIYVLALDSDLAQYEPALIQQISLGMVNRSNTTAVILSDRAGAADTRILVLQSGMPTITIVGLPDQNGLLLSSLQEYDVTNGNSLGGFLQWARASYAADKTMLTIIGHGLPLAPSTDFDRLVRNPSLLTRSAEQAILLPTKLSMHTGLSDHHDGLSAGEHYAIFTPYELARALEAASTASNRPLFDLLDLVHCFSGSIEELYELAPYARTSVAAPSYTYLPPEVLSATLKEINADPDAATMASQLADLHNRLLEEKHPHIVTAIDNSRLQTIKTSWDQVSNGVMQAFAQDENLTRARLLTAFQSAAKYDTTEGDWQINSQDALVDLYDFAKQLQIAFPNSNIATAAGTLLAQFDPALLAIHRRADLPWTKPSATLSDLWAFDARYGGIALYSDFVGLRKANDPAIYLNWVGNWYSADSSTAIPHPYRFIQRTTLTNNTWADVVRKFWSNQTVQYRFYATKLEITAPQIAAGWYHTCAIAENDLTQCWGGNVGNGSAQDSTTPLTVMGLGNGIKSFAAGLSHTCVLFNSGGVKCWGANGEGQLGNGTTNTSYTPVLVSGIAETVQTFSAGSDHTCAVIKDGTLMCWGSNSMGQLGTGDQNRRLVPTLVPGINRPVTAVSAGYRHTCALLNDGSVICWGDNGKGQLGDGSNAPKTTPVAVIGLRRAVIGIEAGEQQSCALLDDQSVQCWGYNGATGENRLPVDLAGLPGSVKQLTAGGDHSCALLEQGSVACWGAGLYGQLGNGGYQNSATPVLVSGLSSSPVVAIDAGQYHTCVQLENRKFQCWGRNEKGQVGDGTTNNRPSPVDVVGLVLP